MPKASAHRRTVTGTVVSDKNDKTIVVRVAEAKMHPKYGKFSTEHKKYHAHDETNSAAEGDTVVIEESRPLSAKKRWTLKTISQKAA